MTAYALRIDGLGKKYRLGTDRNSRPTLRDALASALDRVGVRRPSPQEAGGEFWALRDVSFDVPVGEVMGIVGANGAGKSTLLKILARVVAPTTGRVAVRGRMGALLEVGTGFHPELTGRENIFLNAAILGMPRRETAAKLDEIIAFSGIEPFIDTPVKRYSSGMYLRLAFSVAAHLEPDILIVDEVLAVGDAEFQKKCIGKVGDIARTGRTVLFVSHQLALVQKLCTRAVLIGGGTVQGEGPAHDVIERYLAAVEAHAREDLSARSVRGGRGMARIEGIEFISPAGAPTCGRPLTLRFRIAGAEPVHCSFTIYDEFGNGVTSFDSAERGDGDSAGDELACTIPSLLLRPGRYRVNAALTGRDGALEDHLEGAALFEVQPGLVDGRVIRPEPGYGAVALPHAWTRRDA